MESVILQRFPVLSFKYKSPGLPASSIAYNEILKFFASCFAAAGRFYTAQAKIRKIKQWGFRFPADRL